MLLTACSGQPDAIPTPTLSPIEAKGKEVFNTHCAVCHATSPDVIIVGPSLAGIASARETESPIRMQKLTCKFPY
ncbi:MAG: cytochrome c [Anaerolineae bacterium]|nr:cytochrome c [Anaerolineae bacterium]